MFIKFSCQSSLYYKLSRTASTSAALSLPHSVDREKYSQV